jgi:hypothetical protein
MFTKVKSRAARRCRSNQLVSWKFWIPEEEESMTKKAVVVGLAALGSVAFTAGAASAMPNGLPQAGKMVDLRQTSAASRCEVAGVGGRRMRPA